MRSSVISAAERPAPALSRGILAVFAAAAMLLGLAMSAPAFAQDEAPGAFSESDLEAFAAASLKVEELNAKWMPRLSEAETAEDNAAIRNEAMQEMNEAVRDEGLTVQEYNGIYDAAQSDPRIMQVVEEFREDMQQ